ncbi:hypothetical protein [Streptomyces sp. NPDC058045]
MSEDLSRCACDLPIVGDDRGDPVAQLSPPLISHILRTVPAEARTKL